MREGRKLLIRRGRQRANPSLVMDRAHAGDATRQLVLGLGFTRASAETALLQQDYDRERSENTLTELWVSLLPPGVLFADIGKWVLRVVRLEFAAKSMPFENGQLHETRRVAVSHLIDCLHVVPGPFIFPGLGVQQITRVSNGAPYTG